MKARTKKCVIAFFGVLALFFIYMSQFRYPCVKKGIWMSEARHTADTQPGYFIVTQTGWATGARFMIAYGEYEGTPVELAGNDPFGDLGYVFFWGKTNYCLVHGEERNIENIGIDFYECEPMMIDRMYTIDVSDWEIIMPVRRDYQYETEWRLLCPFWCIDTFDVEHGPRAVQP